MRETTKNTLHEAKITALTAELDEANQKLREIKSDHTQLLAQQQTIAKLQQEISAKNKRITELAASQLSSEQLRRLQAFDKMSKSLDARNNDFTRSRRELDAALSELNDISLETDGLKAQNDKLEAALTGAKKYKKQLQIGVVSALFFAALTSAGSYFYVERELAPPETLSAEAAENFQRFAPEYQQVIKNAIAKKQTEVNKLTAHIQQESPFGKNNPSFIDTYVFPAMWLGLAFVFGLVIGAMLIFAVFTP